MQFLDTIRQGSHHIWRSLPAGAIVRTLAFAATLVPCTSAVAAESRGLFCATPTACELQFYVENDILGGTDRYYTSGLKLGGAVGAEGLVERFFHAPAERVLRHITDDPRGVQFGLFIGQQLYTPREIDIAPPQPSDRPWAAWLYVGGVAQSVSANRLQTVEFDLGVIGPAALGKEVQTAIHEATDSTHPKGWHNQLPNEPAFLLAYMEKWRFGPRSGVQLVPHFGATLGTVLTLARIGATVRAGRNMSGFGPDTIEPGGAMLQGVRLRDPEYKEGIGEWYLFAGADARAVAHNIFLDGNVFRSSPSVDRQEFVYDLKMGFSVRVASARVSFTHTWRSEEFTTPVRGGGNQRFQSLNVSWQF
ncbi:MAG TPA: lipid A deacylase LpxR family protein [Burkholderiales bacterium]|nr:lipid A deacylase LpxR family protein [Burkholderiales bacterium]